MLETMKAEVVVLLCHPSACVRAAAMACVLACYKRLGVGTGYCVLLPMLRPFLTSSDVAVLTERRLLELLRAPLSRGGPSSPTTLSICAALALSTPLVNPGSLYRGGKGTFKRGACGPRQEERGPEMPPKTTFAGTARSPPAWTTAACLACCSTRSRFT